MQDVFRYVQTGIENRKVQGYFTATGVRPRFMDKMEINGIFVSPKILSPVQVKQGRKR